MISEDNIKIYLSQIRDPKKFQELCSVLLHAEFPDFQAIDRFKDMGRDGFTVIKNIVFQAYCPERPEKLTLSKIKTKVSNDLKKAKKHSPSKWIFITPFDFTAKQFEVLKQKKKEVDFKIESWGISKLIELLLKHKYVCEGFIPQIDGSVTIGRELLYKVKELEKLLKQKPPFPKEEVYSLQGRIAHYKGEYAAAINYFQKGLLEDKKQKKINDQHKKFEAIANYNIGINYHYKGDLKTGLKYLLESLKLFEILDLKPNIVDCYNRIGLIYYDKSKIHIELCDEALNYHTKALELAKSLNYYEGVADSNNDLGLVYEYRKNDIKTAFHHYKKALEIDEQIDNKLGMARDHHNLGLLYIKRENLKKSLEHVRLALKLKEEFSPDSIDKADIYYESGKAYIKIGDFKNAKKYLEKALSIYKKLKIEPTTEEIIRIIQGLNQKR